MALDCELAGRQENGSTILSDLPLSHVLTKWTFFSLGAGRLNFQVRYGCPPLAPHQNFAPPPAAGPPPLCSTTHRT